MAQSEERAVVGALAQSRSFLCYGGRRYVTASSVLSVLFHLISVCVCLAAVKFDLRNIYIEVKDASLKWRLLGVALGVEYVELEKIRVKCLSRGDDPDENLVELLQHWINCDANASWDALLSALENVPEQALLMERIREKVFPGEYPALNALHIP